MSEATIPPGPALYVVATPIGNLEDITLRALRILRQCDTILSEDTRKTGILLKHYDISTSQKSYRVNQEDRDVARALEFLHEGRNLAFVSDAGTPGVSDPVSRLVRTIRETMPDVPIVPIPGPSALSAVLSVSGWQANPSKFLGFLSPKPGRRRRALTEAGEGFAGPVVLYESVHRIEALLRDLRDIFPGRAVLVARELTKMYEDIRLIPENLDETEWQENVDKIAKKGEFTVILGPLR